MNNYNPFEQVFRIFFDNDDEYTIYIGHKCYINIDDELRLCVQLLDSTVPTQYDCVKLTILNRTQGVVDCVVLRLSEEFKTDSRVYLWYVDNDLQWKPFASPPAKGIHNLQDSIKNYMMTFKHRGEDNEE